MKKPIRALLLAAGLGTRLRPLTINTPKCLVEIAGQPLLKRWLNQLEKIGCEKALINTHYLEEKVQECTDSWKSKSLSIETFREISLLGTAGTLIAKKEFFKNSTGIMLHADNVTSADLAQFVHAHSKKPDNCLITMLTFKSSEPSKCGIVQTDADGIVKSFHEKIDNPPGNCANGAIYLFDSPFIDWLESHKQAKDFSTEIIPKLINRIFTWQTNAPFFDIGTIENLNMAQSTIKTSIGAN